LKAAPGFGDWQTLHLTLSAAFVKKHVVQLQFVAFFSVPSGFEISFREGRSVLQATHFSTDASFLTEQVPHHQASFPVGFSFFGFAVLQHTHASADPSFATKQVEHDHFALVSEPETDFLSPLPACTNCFPVEVRPVPQAMQFSLLPSFFTAQEPHHHDSPAADIASFFGFGALQHAQSLAVSSFETKHSEHDHFALGAAVDPCFFGFAVLQHTHSVAEESFAMKHSEHDHFLLTSTAGTVPTV